MCKHNHVALCCRRRPCHQQRDKAGRPPRGGEVHSANEYFGLCGASLLRSAPRGAAQHGLAVPLGVCGLASSPAGCGLPACVWPANTHTNVRVKFPSEERRRGLAGGISGHPLPRRCHSLPGRVRCPRHAPPPARSHVLPARRPRQLACCRGSRSSPHTHQPSGPPRVVWTPCEGLDARRGSTQQAARVWLVPSTSPTCRTTNKVSREVGLTRLIEKARWQPARLRAGGPRHASRATRRVWAQG